jgi:hypothetical protein
VRWWSHQDLQHLDLLHILFLSFPVQICLYDNIDMDKSINTNRIFRSETWVIFTCMWYIVSNCISNLKTLTQSTASLLYSLARDARFFGIALVERVWHPWCMWLLLSTVVDGLMNDSPSLKVENYKRAAKECWQWQIISDDAANKHYKNGWTCLLTAQVFSN